MSVWKQSYDALQASERIREALGLLDTVNTEALDSTQLANLARLQKTLNVLDSRMSALDPELFHANTWKNVGAWITNVLTYTREFAQAANVSQLQNANATIDEILKSYAQIWCMS